MFRHNNKGKLLVFGLVVMVLAIGLLVGIRGVSADEPEPKAVILTNGTAIEAIAGADGLILSVTEIGMATDEDEAPVCEDWCPLWGCSLDLPVEWVLPANEAIAWASGCRCEDFGTEENPDVKCCCPEESFCGRTREADWLGWTGSAWIDLHKGDGYVGQKGGANLIALAQFRLTGIPAGEIRKAVVSFDGVDTSGVSEACSDAVFRVDLLSYALSYTWDGNWNYWNYVQDYVVLDTIYKVSADYLRAVTDEDGEVPPIGFRLTDEQASGLEEAIARSRTDYRWSLFVRITLVNPLSEGDCVLKFDQALLTVITD